MSENVPCFTPVLQRLNSKINLPAWEKHHIVASEGGILEPTFVSNFSI